MRQIGKSHWAKFAVVLMMAATAFVSVARGMTFCLCNDDPDECGEVCHECDTGDVDCVHLDVGAADLIPADAASSLAVVAHCFFIATVFSEPISLRVDAVRPRAHAPPNRLRWCAAFLRSRLQPLS